MDMLRAFNAEEKDFEHYFSGAGDKFFNSILFEDEFYDFSEDYKCDSEIVYKRLAKRACKLAFYKVLAPIYGHLPWGALTGIRPTKLAYMEEEEGRDFKELLKKLFVNDKNIELVERVLNAQRGIYKKGGQDLFVSIPFCPSKCEYCSFITAPVSKTEKYLESYIGWLVK